MNKNRVDPRLSCAPIPMTSDMAPWTTGEIVASTVVLQGRMRSPRPPLRAPTASTNDHVFFLPSDDAFPDGATANRRAARETSRVSSRWGTPRLAEGRSFAKSQGAFAIATALPST
jgi:hypothetical protein